MRGESQEETINTILDYFKNIPLSRLIAIKREEESIVKNEVWQKEDSEILYDKGKDSHERLYVIRRENQVNQKDLAKVLNIHPITYHKKEIGKTFFTLPEAFILADYFETTVDDLFRG